MKDFYHAPKHCMTPQHFLFDPSDLSFLFNVNSKVKVSSRRYFETLSAQCPKSKIRIEAKLKKAIANTMTVREA